MYEIHSRTENNIYSVIFAGDIFKIKGFPIYSLHKGSLEDFTDYFFREEMIWLNQTLIVHFPAYTSNNNKQAC